MTTTPAGAATETVLAFPSGFLWGASTAAYQIEGAAHEDGRGSSIWDTFSHTPGRVRRGDTGDIACDAYHRSSDDLDLMASLGLQAYRFSIAWPRIQPTGKGPANQPALDHYRALVDGLRTRGIAPAVTLYHWDLPQSLEDAGGWPERETAERFAEYAAIVGEALGDAVALWITLNEPEVVANQGYRTGRHAPGLRDPDRAAAATHHLLLGHGLATEALRAVLRTGAPVGITLNLTHVRAAEDDALGAATAVDAEANRIFLDPVVKGAYPAQARPVLLPPDRLVHEGDMDLISAPIDFLGVNYYAPTVVGRRDWSELRRNEQPLEGHPGVVTVFPEELARTSMGWLVDPDGLRELLLRLQRDAPGLPLYITENGCAADDYVDPEGGVDDDERVRYLHDHLLAAHQAIGAGVALRGYFVWSLLDNFEWAHGYSRRFGIVFVDFGTQRRVPKQSAAYYSRVVRGNALVNVRAAGT